MSDDPNAQSQQAIAGTITPLQAAMMEANTEAMPARPFKLLPWWRRLFVERWGAETFLTVANCQTVHHNGVRVEWSGSVYRQEDRHFGGYRYFVVGGSSCSEIDGPTYEQTKRLVFP